jgi:hypothetical protein
MNDMGDWERRDESGFYRYTTRGPRKQKGKATTHGRGEAERRKKNRRVAPSVEKSLSEGQEME